MFISNAYDTSRFRLYLDIWSRIAIKTIVKSVHWNKEEKKERLKVYGTLSNYFCLDTHQVILLAPVNC